MGDGRLLIRIFLLILKISSQEASFGLDKMQ
jgi:hypothetical protein